MGPDDLQRKLAALHARFAQDVADLLEVELPGPTYARLKALFDAITDPDQQIANWVVSLYNVQEGLRAAYYHYRNVERLEREVSSVCLEAVRERPDDLPWTNMFLEAPRLTYEYQAFIFALRRSFDYLGSSLALALGCTRPRGFRRLPGPLKHASGENATAAVSITNLVGPIMEVYPEVFTNGSEQRYSLRDRIAHTESVQAGTFAILLRPGEPTRIEVTAGGEGLTFSEHFPGPSPGRLAASLLERLTRFEATLFELVALLPATSTARAQSG